jgi:hypothetical protein
VIVKNTSRICVAHINCTLQNWLATNFVTNEGKEVHKIERRKERMKREKWRGRERNWRD